MRQFGGSPVLVIADEAIIVDARELLGITTWVPGRGNRANKKLEGLCWEELHAFTMTYDRSVSLHPPGPKAAMGCTCLVWHSVQCSVPYASVTACSTSAVPSLAYVSATGLPCC